MTYSELYKSKLLTAAEAAARLEDGWEVASDAGPSQPPAMINAIAERVKRGELKNIKVHTLMDIYPYEHLLNPELAANMQGVSWFSGSGARGAVNAGMADVMPGHYHETPAIVTNYHRIDLAVVSVASMDKHGWFSLSLVNSFSEALFRKAEHIILEVNDQMPRAVCGAQIHISQVDAVIENSHPVPTLPPTRLDETSSIIGSIIAEQIPDGACIQLGIGAVPDAVGLALRDKHDLGIHTELFTDSMVELTLCGAVNNSRKQINRGKSVTTFAYGSQKMYDFIDDNPGIAIMPVDYVNDPCVIAQNDNMISINAALECDIYGQVCSESVGVKHMSGSGGQVDFVRGATMSKGGKSFIAFSSTAKGGTISKIKNILAPGAIVTTGKNDVDYIVTEYGIAHLRFEPLSVRAKNLISIAHPDFRDELTFEARKRGIII